MKGNRNVCLLFPYWAWESCSIAGQYGYGERHGEGGNDGDGMGKVLDCKSLSFDGMGMVVS